jgi:hypothetical protein
LCSGTNNKLPAWPVTVSSSIDDLYTYIRRCRCRGSKRKKKKDKQKDLCSNNKRTRQQDERKKERKKYVGRMEKMDFRVVAKNVAISGHYS